MNNNSMDQLDSIIEELRGVILVMLDDMDRSNDILEKETIRRAILTEEERLLDLIALRETMTEKPE